MQAVCGLSYISGLPGREPSGWGLSYMDNQAAYYNSSALLMAILPSQRDAGWAPTSTSPPSRPASNLLGPVLLDVEVNGRTTRRPDYPTGNRLEHPDAAPHGVYPDRGDDRWMAIAVFDDAEWAGLFAMWSSLRLWARRALRHPRGSG